MTRFRSVFLSDVHLGSRWSKASDLTAFLSDITCDAMYLVGDFLDSEKADRLKRPESPHRKVIEEIFRHARTSPVTYITGNHDAFLDRWFGGFFAGANLRERAIHETADGRRFLVAHGDDFDRFVKKSARLEAFGNRIFNLLLWADAGVNSVMEHLGMHRKVFAGTVKNLFRVAAGIIEQFEESLADEAEREECDGIICGHTHLPVLRKLRDLLYCNCGDWVQHCSVLVEHFDGRMEILRWTPRFGLEPLQSRPALMPPA